MSPLHPFPAALEDAVAVYKEIMRKHSAGSIIIGGSSAGGGLSLATVHQLKTLGLNLPGAIWVGTPWADLSKTGDSLFTNEGVDRVVVTYDGVMEAMARLYASGENLKNPLISPVYGEFNGFPPTQLVTGTRDLFLSDTVRTHRKMRAAGVAADLNVYEGFSHAEYLMVPDSAESREVLLELDSFIENIVPVME
jgi:acetyl esterase/lipase